MTGGTLRPDSEETLEVRYFGIDEMRDAPRQHACGPVRRRGTEAQRGGRVPTCVLATAGIMNRKSRPMNRLEFTAALAATPAGSRTPRSDSPPSSSKGRHDVVTAMDGEVERFIRSGDRATLPGRRDHRRGAGRAAAVARVAHRSDRRHRELRARHPALLRVDRLSRTRRADGRRPLRPQPRAGSTQPRAARARRSTASASPSVPATDMARRPSNAAGRRGAPPPTTSHWCSA